MSESHNLHQLPHAAKVQPVWSPVSGLIGLRRGVLPWAGRVRRPLGDSAATSTDGRRTLPRAAAPAADAAGAAEVEEAEINQGEAEKIYMRAKAVAKV